MSTEYPRTIALLARRSRSFIMRGGVYYSTKPPKPDKFRNSRSANWQSTGKQKPASEKWITCKRGSAKHSVKDNHVFLWKKCYFQPRAQPKPPNRSRWNFAWLIMSVRLRDVSKMVAISWLEAAHKQVKYNLKNFSYTIPYFTSLPYLFFFSSSTGLTDLHAWWLKQRGLL
jgi:hypothetical protein